MTIDELRRPMTEAEKARFVAAMRSAAGRPAPYAVVTTTRDVSRLRLAWWRLRAWFREAVR